ncbi:hypothetical protein B0T10DRAFT_545321 [Thelonectria olida]|uniref:Uncharacterized protein n=1 Tax=Thelonectria olida TaxID=1576542 RepID=A0A9P8WD27_9HYPO|nr:hypothetical protein B0T10DRAFT_545321 [Thelonectria olida]
MPLTAKEQDFLGEIHSECLERLPYSVTFIFWHMADWNEAKRIQWKASVISPVYQVHLTRSRALIAPQPQSSLRCQCCRCRLVGSSSVPLHTVLDAKAHKFSHISHFRQGRSYYSHNIQLQVQRHGYGPSFVPGDIWMYLREPVGTSDAILMMYDVMNRESFRLLPLLHHNVHRAAPCPLPKDAPPPATRIRTCARAISTLMELICLRTPTPQRREEQGVPTQVQYARDEGLEKLDISAKTGGIKPRPFPFIIIGVKPRDQEVEWSVSSEEAEDLAKGIGAELYLIQVDDVGDGSDNIFSDVIGQIMFRRVFGLGAGSVLYT